MELQTAKALEEQELKAWAHLIDGDSTDENRDSDSSLVDEEEYDSEVDNLEEDAIAQALVKAAFKRVIPDDVVRQLLMPPRKKLRSSESSYVAAQEAVAVATRAKAAVKKFGRLSQSLPCLSNLTKENSPDLSNASTKTPDEVLRSRLSSSGFVFKTYPADSVKDFFLEVTEKEVEGYTLDVIQAVRQDDVGELRKMMDAGRVFQCSNRYGDSLVHAACRRGSTGALKFLLQEAKVSCRVCCDYGRTALHDACWTPYPNFEIIELLLEACPDLLYITDKRGSTPLGYVRRDQWNDWSAFLNDVCIEALVPKQLS